MFDTSFYLRISMAFCGWGQNGEVQQAQPQQVYQEPVYQQQPQQACQMELKQFIECTQTGIGINLRKTRRENDKDHMYELYKIFVAFQLSMQHKEVVVKHVCLCVEKNVHRHKMISPCVKDIMKF
jgi:hypothetical protein